MAIHRHWVILEQHSAAHWAQAQLSLASSANCDVCRARRSRRRIRLRAHSTLTDTPRLTLTLTVIYNLHYRRLTQDCLQRLHSFWYFPQIISNRKTYHHLESYLPMSATGSGSDHRLKMWKTKRFSRQIWLSWTGTALTLIQPTTERPNQLITWPNYTSALAT